MYYYDNSKKLLSLASKSLLLVPYLSSFLHNSSTCPPLVIRDPQAQDWLTFHHNQSRNSLNFLPFCFLLLSFFNTVPHVSRSRFGPPLWPSASARYMHAKLHFDYNNLNHFNMRFLLVHVCWHIDWHYCHKDLNVRKWEQFCGTSSLWRIVCVSLLT